MQPAREIAPEFGARVATEGTESKVEYAPDAPAEGDRATLSEDEAFEDVHPHATAETFEAQTRREATFPGSALRETARGDSRPRRRENEE